MSGQTRLRFELNQVVPDRRQRIVAQRWPTGATLGAEASSFFDGTAWHTGTFDDATGEARAGIYILELRGGVWR